MEKRRPSQSGILLELSLYIGQCRSRSDVYIGIFPGIAGRRQQQVSSQRDKGNRYEQQCRDPKDESSSARATPSFFVGGGSAGDRFLAFFLNHAQR